MVADNNIAPSFLLVVLALATFLLSTRQYKLWIRGLIWLFGALLLALSYYLLPDRAAGHYGLIAMLLDALSHGRDSVFSQSLFGNWRAVAGNLAPMFDILIALALGLGFLALIAFTPGEWLEKMLRPLFVFAFGVIAGGFLVLVISAAGLGHAKDRVYAGIAHASDVIDGDTLRMGDVSLRLYGVDAPEYHRDAANQNLPSSHNQFCFNALGQRYPCGRAAAAALQRLIDGQLVSCRPSPQLDRRQRVQLAQILGRPIVQCMLHQAHGPDIDIAQALAQQGQVDALGAGSPYAADVQAAQAQHLGIWASTNHLTPDQWRNRDDKRDAFIAQLRDPSVIDAPLAR
ncbi:MAG: thermonuclease family protein [Terricaulis silvestris]